MNRPALLIAGTHSGCGKTTLTLGIMAALARRGLVVQPFKCGPDFIDPTLHRMVTGRISRNLDVRMCGADFVRHTFTANRPPESCAVVEGVMGLFDGGEGSAAFLARTLGLPVFLVIDVRSAAESIAAVVKGFAGLDPHLDLAGVICNRVGSEKHQNLVAGAIREHCPTPIIGFFPRRDEVHIPSRHLGLHMGEEHPLKGDGLEHLAQLTEQHLDLDLLLRIAAEHCAGIAPTPAMEPSAPMSTGPRVRLGVARDAAFCFYYQDNLDLLCQAGAELVFFSPIEDTVLPPGIEGLYLGGGYPELHARQLSANLGMREQIHCFARAGRPVYGECGGFMYLCRALVDLEGNDYPMVGLYPWRTRMQTRLRSLGYRRPTVTRDCLLGEQGTVLHGHEFHYSTLDQEQPSTESVFRLDDNRSEGYIIHHQTLAGYIHLHWGRTPEAASRFVQACRQSNGDLDP
ncbi:cobyrinate a,c-diamide synthase [Desulfobulbus alkaliphilus]|uniref:cobyrinate a,c-diamide synthase n=1 Tax=Desulfobulbus alkaliphilus TaxID=869814 RepID=UPI001963B9DE|nr:cobyrinate a,c-diamide synthase [Desulfobulbus alkaliphilus]MBM9537049.1 cobyrinate a,c-diamide synthase [Desulfobulbus alkaliphilus]